MISFYRQKYYGLKLTVTFLVLLTFIFNFVLTPYQALIPEASAEPSDQPQEVIEKRTENSKHFKNPDGTFTAHLYPGPIHYKKDNVWKEIDPNIVQKADGGFEDGGNKFNINFGKKSKDTEFTSVELNGLKVSYSLNNLPQLGSKFNLNVNDVLPVTEENKITYQDIFPGVDVRQTVTTNGLKEDIVLKEYNGKNSFVFNMKSPGLDAVKEEDGSISFYKQGESTKEKVFFIEKPFMQDSNIDPTTNEGQRSESVTLDVIEQGANTYITISADEEWLKAPERKYPVSIDPTTNLSCTGDSMVKSGSATTNYGTNTSLYTGYYDATTGTYYSYLNFSTSSISGKLVTSALLKVYCNYSQTASPGNGVWVDTANASWSQSTITWNNKPASTPVLDNGSNEYVNVYSGQWASLNVTDPVAGWVSSPAQGTNYGFKLHTNGNGQSYHKRFNSMEATTNKPYLAVTYSEPPATPTATPYGNSSGSSSGYVDLSWTAVTGATGYKVGIYNGLAYEWWDVGNVTSWTTKNKRIWPTTTEINLGRYLLHHDSLGDELAEDPHRVYTNSGGSYPNNKNYWFRVKAYSAFGETTQSGAAMPTLPDRTLPTASIVSPADNSTTTQVSGELVSLEATASDNTGVTLVEFYVDDIKVGESTTAPYNCLWQSTVGNHILNAKAYDAAGNVWYSYDSRVKVPTRVTITDPVNGSTVGGIKNTFSATFGDPVRDVALYIDGVYKTGTYYGNTGVSSTTFNYSWDTNLYANGTPHTIKITGATWDSLGGWLTAESTSTITVDNTIDITPPSVSITSPVNDTTTSEVSGDMLSITTNATDYVGVSKVEFYVDSIKVGETSSAPFNYQWQCTGGTHTLMAKAYDAAGNVGTSSNVVIKVPLRVTITDPLDGSAVSGIKNSFRVAFSEDPRYAYLYIDGVQRSSVYTHMLNWTFDYNWDTTQYADGTTHIIKVTSEKFSNGYWITSESTSIVTIDNTPPLVTITNPSIGNYVSGIADIVGTINDENIDRGIVYFGAGSNPTLWTEIGSVNQNIFNGVLCSWDTRMLLNGDYTIKVKGLDKAGNSIESTVTVYVDNTAPAVSFVAPNGGQEVNGTVTVSGVGSDNTVLDRIDLSLKKYGTTAVENVATSTSSNPSWTLDTTKYPDGEYVLLLNAYDIAGNVVTNSLNVLINNTPEKMGTESFWASTDNDLGTVNMVSGNFIFTQTDVNIPGRGLNTVIARTYNSQDNYDGPLGKGWRFSIPQISLLSNGDAVITDDDGTEHKYIKQADGTFQRPVGVYYSLELINNEYIWKYKTGEETHVFNTSNNTVVKKDRNGNTVTYSFGTDGKLLAVNDPVGRTITLNYSTSTGYLTKITDFTGRYWDVTVTTDHINIAGPKPQVENSPVKTVDIALTSGIQTVTDGSSIKEVTYSNGKVSVFKNKLSATQTDTTSYAWPESLKFTETDTFNNLTTYILNANGTLASKTTKVVDENGQQVDVTERYTYYNDLLLWTKEDALGRVTTYTYTTDGWGDVATEQEPFGLTSSDDRTTTYTYENHQVKTKTITGMESAQVTYEYDSRGNQTFDGNKTVSHYNELGLLDLQFTRDPANPANQLNKVTYTYNPNGYMLTSTDADGNTVSFQYNALGLKELETDATFKQTQNVYDQNGWLLRVIENPGTLEQTGTSYTYDTNGNKLTVTDAMGAVTNYQYNYNSQVTRVDEPGGLIKTYSFRNDGTSDREESYKLDQYGNKIELKWTQNTYDGIGKRLEKVEYADGRSVNYKYDLIGNTKKKQDYKAPNTLSRTTDYTYYRDNNINTETLTVPNKPIKTITYTYTKDGKMLNKTVAGSDVTYNYTKELLDSMVTSSGSITFSYNLNQSRTENWYLQSNAKVVWGFDENGTKTDKMSSVTNLDGTGIQLSKFTYTYDPNGNVLTATNVATGTQYYEYDEKNRLKNIRENSITGNVIEGYEYDDAGNRTKVKKNNGTVEIIYDRAETGKLKLITLNGGVEDVSLRVTYTFDASGNITTKLDSSGTTTYHYNANNQLDSVVKPDGTTVTFEYDGENRRISKTVNGVKVNFAYDDSEQLISETDDATGQVIASYYYDDKGMPVSMVKGSHTYYYHYNGHGDVVTLTDENGSKVSEFSYDIWGNVASTAQPVESVFGYAGQYGYAYDKEIGLYFLKSRYYDPQIGQFTSKDRFKGFENRPASQNPYTYCENDPVNKYDEDGYWAWAATLFAFSFAIPGWGQIALGIAVFAAGLYVGYRIFYASEHTKNARKSTWNKHTKPRSGRSNTKNRSHKNWRSKSNKRR